MAGCRCILCTTEGAFGIFGGLSPCIKVSNHLPIDGRPGAKVLSQEERIQ